MFEYIFGIDKGVPIDIGLDFGEIIGASLSEPHTSEIFRRVNHTQQKTDKNDCRLKFNKITA